MVPAGHEPNRREIMNQYLLNLCTNAFHAMEETCGTLSITLKRKFLSQNDLPIEQHIQPREFVQISIADTGSGIAPDIRERIFEPYFTTKETGKGTGMGLAIVHGIVKAYGGVITCQSQPGEGTVFDVYLPVIEDAALLEIESPDIPQLGREHILYIDDKETLAEMGKDMLERLGYRVTTRTSSIEALSIFQDQPDSVDLVISDQTMPEMTGYDLARRMLQIRPDLPIILCTGYSSQVSEEKARAYGIKGFALKPLERKDISVFIRKVLDEGKSIV
jgi:CheY-like chemotaxis protein